MATLDKPLLEVIREGSRALWRGVRTRLLFRLTLLGFLVQVGFFGGFWLLAEFAGVPLPRGAFKAGTILLSVAALLGGLGLAWADAVHALIVTGPFLRSLGDILLGLPLGSGGRRSEDLLAAFASPESLARAARLRDLPLLLFLTRVAFRLDFKPLIGAAHAGLGRETLVREMERLCRQRAAMILSRLRAIIWLSLGSAVMLFLPIALFSR
jgi:hypothetical protein